MEFTDLKVLPETGKWTTKCKNCKLIITEKRRTTSEFIK